MECNTEALSLIKPPLCFCWIYTIKFYISYLFGVCWTITMGRVVCFLQVQERNQALGGLFILLSCPESDRGGPDYCMFLWGTGDKISILLQIHVLPENNFETKGGLALHFFIFRINEKYQTMSFRLTVVLFPELEIMKQWQVFIKLHLQAHYDICNN